MKRTKLSKLRQSRGLSQKQLSSNLEISSGYLSEIERGVKTPSLAIANKLEDFFRIPQRQILKLDGEDEH